MKAIFLGALFCTLVAAEGIQDSGPQEQVLHAGSFPAKAGSSRTIQKTFEPWRLEWESYPYKQFYPSINEEKAFWHSRTLEKVPAGIELPFKEGKAPQVQAREAFAIRFFEMPDVKDHTRKKWHLRWPGVLDAKWEAFDVLRMDVEFPSDTHVWWALEDKLVQPPVVGNYDVKANTKVTLELDYKQAVQERGLDLKNMWRTWVRHNLEQGTGQFENVRLSRRDAPASLPLLRDPRATHLPEHPAAKKPPQPDVPQDLTPLTGPRTLVYKSDAPLTTRWGGNSKRGGGMSVYDANHILLCVNRITNTKRVQYGGDFDTIAVQTGDGAQTWKGLNGAPERSYLMTTIGMQSEAIDAQGGFILSDEGGCQNDPGPRHRMMVFTFQGKEGWTFNEKKYVFEEEGRQCSHYGEDFADFMRAPSGRLWTSLRVLGREWPDWRAVHVKYSDNEGQSWHSWREGFKASIPETHSFKGYPYPRMVPYGDFVAVFMKVEREHDYYSWTHFDGTQWAPLEKVPMSVTSVASVGPKEILLAGPEGILRLADGKWVLEAKLDQDPGTLVQSGKNILAFAAAGGKVMTEIHVRYRSPEGKWSEPQVHKVGAIKELYVPEYVPGNLGAALYINSDETSSAKVLLVPSQKSPE